MDSLCPVHQVPFKLVPAGVSKKTGQPYNAFYSCPTMGCKMKPNQPVNNGGQGGFQDPTPVGSVKYPSSASPRMSREDWEAKDAKKNKDILLQVAFKAAVELQGEGKTTVDDLDNIQATTLRFHKWLLSQTEVQKPATFKNPADALVGFSPAPSDDYEAGNRAIEEAQAEDLNF